MLNITKGNSIKLRAIFSIDDTPFHVVNSNDLSVRLVSMYRAYECPYRIDVAEDDILYITVPADVSVGIYGLEVKGKLNKMDWRTFTHEVLEITYETVQGDESAVVPASDAYDVKMEVQVNKADEEQQLIEELVRRVVYSGNYIKDKNGITFYNKDNDAVFAVSLDEMEKPDNVRNIDVKNGYLVLEFESSQDKKVSISQIFDKTKYYEKTAVDEKFVSASQTLFGRIVEDEDVILKETYPTNPNEEFQICYLSAKGFFAYYDGYSYHTIFKNDYLYNKYLNNFIEPHIGKIFFCAEDERHYIFKFGQFISLDEEVQGDFVIDENYVHTDNNYTSEEKEKLADLHNYDDTAVRQLIADTNANFANYYDKQESYSAVEIDTMLRTQRQGRFVISEELPVASADTMFKIYLIPSESAKEANVKDEFITLQNGEDEYSWEQVGSTAVDLSGYSTTEEMNAAISAALSSYYSKTDIDGKLSEISTALGERYTKTEIDTKLANKADKEDVYTKDTTNITDFISGYYINRSGEIKESEGSISSISTPIKVKAGDIINCEHQGVAIACISVTDKDGSFYAPVRISNNDTGVVLSTYEVPEDCYIAVSSRTIALKAWVESPTLVLKDETFKKEGYAADSKSVGLMVDEIQEDLQYPSSSSNDDAWIYKERIPNDFFARPEVPTVLDYNTYIESKILSVPQGKHFIFITDPHWRYNSKVSTNIVQYVKKRLNIPFVICGGDAIHRPANKNTFITEGKKIFVDGSPQIVPSSTSEYEGTIITPDMKVYQLDASYYNGVNEGKIDALIELSEYAEEMKGTYGNSFLYVTGNHDLGTANLASGEEESIRNSRCISFSDIVKNMHSNITDVVVYDEEGLNNVDLLTTLTTEQKEELRDYIKQCYYVDDKKNKLRYIVTYTGTAYDGICSEIFNVKSSDCLCTQLPFVAGALMSLPKDYDVVIFGHYFGNSSSLFYCSQWLSALIVNYKQKGTYTCDYRAGASEMFKTWLRARTTVFDFKLSHSRYVFIVEGHWHSDYGQIITKNTNASSSVRKYDDIKSSNELLKITVRNDGPVNISPITRLVTDSPDTSNPNLKVTDLCAFDIMTLTEEGQVVCTRIGYGEDRTFNISSEEMN